MTTIAPENRYFRVEPLRVRPGHSPPSGPAIQDGKKLACVVGDRMLGRSAAITTISTLQATISSRTSAPMRASVRVAASASAGLPESPRSCESLAAPTGVSRRGSVLASLDMRRGPPKRAPKRLKLYPCEGTKPASPPG